MTDEAMSPLRRRMIEDMTIRKFRAAQHDDLQWVKNSMGQELRDSLALVPEDRSKPLN